MDINRCVQCLLRVDVHVPLLPWGFDDFCLTRWMMQLSEQTLVDLGEGGGVGGAFFLGCLSQASVLEAEAASVHRSAATR